jgi:hypothetical protein
LRGERTGRIAWGARQPVRRHAQGPNPEHPAWGGKRHGAGRKPGSKDKRPRKPGLAFQNQLRNFGLPDDARPEARDLVNFAVDRVADVIAERVPAALSPSVLKGSAMIIEMLCTRSAGGRPGTSFEQLVRAAAKEIDDEEMQARMTKVAGVLDAEYAPVATIEPTPASDPHESVSERITT